MLQLTQKLSTTWRTTLSRSYRDTQGSQQAQSKYETGYAHKWPPRLRVEAWAVRPEPSNDHMEGARRDCKSRDAPPPEEKAAKRRQELAKQELARNVASLPPPEGA